LISRRNAKGSRSSLKLKAFEIVAEFVEVETGKGSDALDRRPQLSAALAKTRSVRCPVAVGKLDRLSRDVLTNAAERPRIRPV
jgi:hypothetical protein